MRATQADHERLNNELHNIVEQMKALGAAKVILFGSLARQQISLFSDIDLLVLFDDERPSRELGRWAYQNLHTNEAVDLLVYSQKSFMELKQRPFFRHILSESKVLYERL